LAAAGKCTPCHCPPARRRNPSCARRGDAPAPESGSAVRPRRPHRKQQCALARGHEKGPHAPRAAPEVLRRLVPPHLTMVCRYGALDTAALLASPPYFATILRVPTSRLLTVHAAVRVFPLPVRGTAMQAKIGIPSL